MRLIITESQYKKILSENINSDNKIINALKDAINKGIDKFVSENKTSLDKSSKILDANSIVIQFKNYLISQTPSLLQQMKTGKGGDVFAETAYKGLYSIIQSNLNNIGWAKRQLIKGLSPGKDDLLNQMKVKNIDEYFQTFKQLLDLSFKIGTMNEVQPYSDNLDKWSNQLYNWVDSRRKSIKENFINLIINSIYK
jgi:hypothetical protein